MRQAGKFGRLFRALTAGVVHAEDGYLPENPAYWDRAQNVARWICN